MCTLALYFRVFDHYPLVVAANRDEHYDRPSAPPALIQVHPGILAGRDLRAGGTWLGINDQGLLAGILNRRSDGEQNPRPGIRSRGLLCLDALTLTTAAEARAFIRAHQNDYQPFTLLCADGDEAWSAHNQEGRIITKTLEPGIHVFSSAGEKTAGSDKRDRAYRGFARFADELHSEATGTAGDFLRLQAVLADHTVGDGSDDPRDAICMHGEAAGTVSSSILVHSPLERRFRTFYCSGAPCGNDFGQAIDLDLR